MRRPAPPRRIAGMVAAVVVVVVLVTVLAMARPWHIRRPAPAAPPAPVAPAWREVTPPGAGPGERFVFRDVVGCAGRWFLVGAVVDATGATQPAAWTGIGIGTGTGAGGQGWQRVRISARTYYGRQNILLSVSCRQGRMAALGAKSGGAHGNPRTSSWRETPEGALAEVVAPFELFGGPQAVNVVRIDAGADGWLITGNRIKGAAVWTSPDSAAFTLVEGAPQLASDARAETWAFDSVDTPSGWLVVGGELLVGRIDRDPVGWSSRDGRSWVREPAPSTSAYEELQRVVLADGVAVAAGLRGATFGAWQWAAPDPARAPGWRALGGFGVVKSGGLSGVRSLAAFGGRLFSVTTDGDAYSLWVSMDGGQSWRAVSAPVSLPAHAEQIVTAAGDGGRVTLLVDDGFGGQVFSAETGW